LKIACQAGVTKNSEHCYQCRMFGGLSKFHFNSLDMYGGPDGLGQC
jgi:hypothetical protein